jgi:ABC-type transporter Mla subunit MlaD
MPVLLDDTSELHAMAHRIRCHADAVRRLAGQLSARADQARWRSPAARAFRERVGRVGHAMRTSAGRLDDAADALDRHACRVHELLEDLQRAAAAVLGPGMQVLEDTSGFVGSALRSGGP